jgi:hypothetical protein
LLSARRFGVGARRDTGDVVVIGPVCAPRLDAVTTSLTIFNDT